MNQTPQHRSDIHHKSCSSFNATRPELRAWRRLQVGDTAEWNSALRAGSQPYHRTLKAKLLAILFALGILAFSPSAAGADSSPSSNSIISQPLSLADAVNLALRQNPNILRTQKDVAAAEGIAIQTRALAIPKLRVTGNYTAVQPTDVDRPNVSNNIPGFTFGTDQSWASQVRLVQSIYEGGRVVSLNSHGASDA